MVVVCIYTIPSGKKLLTMHVFTSLLCSQRVCDLDLSSWFFI